MKHILVQMISQMTKISSDEAHAIESYFPIKTYSKGAYILKQGQICENSYLIIKGCIREYELLDGIEKTFEFYTENETAVNYTSLTQKKPSKINFICTEETTVAVTNIDNEKEFYDKFPRFKVFCFEEMDKIIGEQREKLKDFFTLKPEDRYLKLQNERPDLLNRVPQYQIASYLGIKPETLSRIRSRLTTK